jgi:CheY-like chemotaxis protein
VTTPRDPITRQRLLLVEDDADLREALREALETSGYVVECATNGREALDYLETSAPPCVVLLDLMMPVMNGWEFRERQSRDDRISTIPIVILTADGRADLKAQSLGADDYLRKPIQFENLLRVVERFAC